MLTLTPSGAGAFFLAGAGYPNSLKQKYAMNEQMIEQQSQHYEAVFPTCEVSDEALEAAGGSNGFGGGHVTCCPGNPRFLTHICCPL